MARLMHAYTRVTSTIAGLTAKMYSSRSTRGRSTILALALLVPLLARVDGQCSGSCTFFCWDPGDCYSGQCSCRSSGGGSSRPPPPPPPRPSPTPPPAPTRPPRNDPELDEIESTLGVRRPPSGSAHLHRPHRRAPLVLAPHPPDPPVPSPTSIEPCSIQGTTGTTRCVDRTSSVFLRGLCIVNSGIVGAHGLVTATG